MNTNDHPDQSAADFAAVMDDVKPLEQDSVTPYRARRRPEPLNLPVGDEREQELADLAVETPEFFDVRRPGVQKRLYHDLQRGLLPPEETLDLHGMRVVEAQQLFLRFLTYCRRNERRCVRIIHGKGRGSADRQPVLKQKTYQWLLQTDDALAFCTAPRWDGGTGAVYVLLGRRGREQG